MRQMLRFGWVLCLSLLFTIVAGRRTEAAGPINPAGPSAFNIQIVGHGRPMLLIPGLASSGDTWKTTVARYQDRFTCYVLTLAGFADVPPIDSPVFATARRELAEYMREQHLDKPIVVGHSLGGTLALALAVDHPELVGPLVIVDSLPFLAGAQLSAKSVADARPQAAAMRAYMSSMTRPQYEQYLKASAPTRFLVTADRDHEVIKGWSLASDPATVGNAMADLYGLDLREDLARIDAPTLVLGTWAGVRDQVQSAGGTISRAAVIAQFEQQFAKLPRLHFVLAETRHFIMFDDASWFLEQLDAFLANPAASVADRGFSANGAGR